MVNNLTTRMAGTLTLCGEAGLTFGGITYRPDATKAFIQFNVSSAFPNATVTGLALHPNVIARSYTTLQNQNVNLEHQLKAYFTDGSVVRDKVVGSVAAVSFPSAPVSGWTIAADASKAPCISGVAAVFKQTDGTAGLFDDYVSKRRPLTVSMECLWPLEEAGFAIALGGKSPLFGNETPADMVAAGFEYVPYEKAPPELRATYSEKKRRVIATYKGRKVTVLMGGLNGEVHYSGIGLVRWGAEPKARITTFLASGKPTLAALLDNLVAALKASTAL